MKASLRIRDLPTNNVLCQALLALLLSLCCAAVLPAGAGADTVTYSYDRAGRLTSARYGSARAIEYRYDLSGNIVRKKIGKPTPAITLRRPNGGEELRSGKRYKIAWATAGSLQSVSIVLLRETGTRVKATTIASDVPNRGRYAWAVPKQACARCKIRVKGGKDIVAESEDYFSIK